VDRASETDGKVAGLANAADRIGDVVRLITDIAGQTNLLPIKHHKSLKLNERCRPGWFAAKDLLTNYRVPVGMAGVA
jgi:hypothetical protein